MKDKLLELLEKAKKPYSLDTICSKLNVIDEDKESVEKILNDLEEDFSIIKTSNNHFVLLEKTSFRKGRVVSEKGKLFALVREKKKNRDGDVLVLLHKYEIPEKNGKDAIEKDIVLINLFSEYKNGPKYADVKRVIDRKLKSISGSVYHAGLDTYIRPFDKRQKKLLIKLNEYVDDDINVSADIIEYLGDNTYLGKVKRYIYDSFEPNDDILVEAYKCGITDEFSKEALEEVKNIPKVVLDSDRIGREDLTKELIFTIDCDDTKDIDDAVSFKKLSNGNYLIGVHIVDVGHYIKVGSALDMDAYNRGTSTYLANKVIPMLPKELSNGICSLNPNVDRLAISTFMEYKPNGSLVDYRICKSVINSKKKMCYSMVNNILYDREYDESYEPYVSTLKDLNTLARILRKNRMKKGAVDFDSSELKLLFDEEDNVVDIENRVCDLAENLIEEYMLSTNEVIDKHLTSRGHNMLHRVHDYPNVDNMKDFFALLKKLNCEYTDHDYYECSNNPKYLKDLQKFIDSTGELSYVLNRSLIRCMAKAKYSPENIGHFGLAKEDYCHFTSPDRRYPDLVDNRILSADLDNKNEDVYSYSELEEIGMSTSNTERRSADCEREVLKLKVCEYFENNCIGKSYKGIITGVSENGLDITLDNLVEGNVELRDIKGKTSFNENELSLITEEGTYTMGERLLLNVKYASKKNKKLCFSILEKVNSDNDNNKIYKKL